MSKQVASDAPTVSVERQWPSSQRAKWTVTLEFGFVAGRVQCIGFSVRSTLVSESFTPALLRKIPIRKLIDEVLDNPTRELVQLAGLPPFNLLTDLASAGLEALRRPKSRAKAERGRPVVYGSEHYARVAEIYRASSRAPTQTVADEFDVNRTTAANWVRRCRQLGLLNPVGTIDVRGKR